MAGLPLEELVAPDWAEALAGVEAELRAVLSFLAGEVAAGHQVLPSPSNVLRAFLRPLADVRVLIVGQDPYPTPGHAVGLAFSVDGRTRPIPRSLANIYKELEADLGSRRGSTATSVRWADQGVLLLNRVLSVREGAAGSHRGKGWETITTAAVGRRRRPPDVRRRQAPVGGGPVGKGRRRHPPAAGRHPRGGQRPPQSAVGLPRFLRFAAVQPRQRPARRSRALAPWTGNFRRWHRQRGLLADQRLAAERLARNAHIA